MRDPLDELRKLTIEEPTGHRLPAHEVRRRGDRMRHRRTAFSAVGAAAAVALIASGGLFVTDALTGADPAPGPATHGPSPTAPASPPTPTSEEPAGPEIPEDLPVGAGLGPLADNEMVTRDDTTDQQVQWVDCGRWPAIHGRRTAARSVVVTGDFRGRLRQVLVYEDAETARAVLDGYRSVAGACTEGEPLPGTRPMAWEVVGLPSSGTPEESGWVKVTGSDTTDGSHPWFQEMYATRVGSAVVVSQRGQNEPIATADSLESSHGRVVAALCRYTDDACTSVDLSTQTADPERDLWPAPTPAQEPSAEVTEIPDSVDLTEGLNDADSEIERTSISRVDAPWFYDPCQSQGQSRDEGRTDFLVEAESGPASSQFRQLAVYPSAKAADAVLDEWFVGSILDCAVFRYDDGVSEEHWDALASGWVPADRAHVYVSTSWTSDMRMTPAAVFVVARVGNAIVVVGRDGEFGASDATVSSAVEDLKPYVTDLLTQQLCDFRGAGTC